MAAEETKVLQEAYPMKGGDGLYSYAKNSTYQRKATGYAKELIKAAIAGKLDKEILLSSKTFRIADLGCSVGPNTFSAVQNILEAVESKYQYYCQELNPQIPDFQVFFNDHTSNDFNLLFTSLPNDRGYYAAGVPGSFYGRLFPENSIHFVHSSYAIQWLSGVPKELVNKNSPAWNKGRIHYSSSGDEVVMAYKAQFDKDMEQFLQARAQEIVCGGLMVLIFPGIPNGTHHSQNQPSINFEILGSCLMDLARKGMISEEKVDSFNIPTYNMSPQELEAAVERNGCFSIEGKENLPLSVQSDSGDQNISGQFVESHLRAVVEGIIKQHFGEKILDVLFDCYRRKLHENFSIFESGKMGSFFFLLKRRAAN